jgi:small subunit ribosomal protein S4
VDIDDEISLRNKSRKVQSFATNFATTSLSVSYIEKDPENFSGKLITMPRTEDVPVEVKYSKVLEFYSKN